MNFERLSKLALLGLGLFVAFWAYTEWSRDSARRAKNDSASAQRLAVGDTAAAAADKLMAAFTACKIVDILNDMEKCAAQNGVLPLERAAANAARTAIDARAQFYVECQRTNGGDYCSQLLQRAVNIVARLPGNP